MSKKEDVFKNALEGKKIPVLILDNKWHKIFNHADTTHEIKVLEERLNDLIKRQGKVNTESKDIKKIKKTLMNEVMVIADGLMQSPDSKRLNKQMDEHKRLIEECNEKLEDYEEEMLELPREIDRTNKKLMLATMESCYKKLQENTKELSTINEWIRNVRRELKKRMVRKQEKEAQNNELYSYMHDIFGADVIELFDMKYNPDGNNEEDSKGTEYLEEED
ncbi:MAG: hypothetical protein K2K21_07645 [Lachnospiraceae bacterium]|nr:hypothetical protein [Lachnospiraceae bacterium]